MTVNPSSPNLRIDAISESDISRQGLPSARIAILGCGSIGLRHLRNLLALGYRDIVAYDPIEEARAAARDLGAHACTHLDAIWEHEPDVALICTPSNLHPAHARAAAEHGAHLFIEKPVAHSLAGLTELTDLIAANGLIDLVGCNMRFHPGPALLKSLLAQESIGPILSARLHTGSYLPRWRPHQDYRASYSASPEWGGAVLDCIHEIDLALWLLGPAYLHAALTLPATAIGLETDGLAELLLAHANGALSSVHLNFVQRNYRRSIEVIGADGSLTWDFNQAVVCWYGPDGQIRQSYPQPENWALNDMYGAEMHYFLSCVRDGIPTFNTVAHATETLRIALQAKEHRLENRRHHSGPCQIQPSAR
jgi:predicted dehydrogenase